MGEPTSAQRAARHRLLRGFTERIAQMDDASVDEGLELAWSEQRADDATGWLWISCLAAAMANRLEGIR